MVRIHIGPLIAAIALVTASASASPPADMESDVLAMIRAAHKLDSLMPWASPVAELDRVVRLGKGVTPLLIRLLPDDPDDPELSYWRWDERAILSGKQFDWHVEQQAAVALCRIYQVSSPRGGCPMYSNRASREYNKTVKPFFLKVIADDQAKEDSE